MKKLPHNEQEVHIGAGLGITIGPLEQSVVLNVTTTSVDDVTTTII